MGMLDRIKKRQLDGFKEFVQNMEITGSHARVPIFTAGILEDPIFMSWVMKNIKTFDDFLKLSGDDIEAVLKSQDQLIGVFAKAMSGAAEEELMNLESLIPRYMSRFKDELNYLKEVPQTERDSARFYVVKIARKLQQEEKIIGFGWKLPPMDVFYPKTMKDGQGRILFEDGTLAAEGEYAKGKRSGEWHHYYDNGRILAVGNYLDGLKTGDWAFYYTNGNQKALGKYKGDQRNGVWKEWDRAGVLTEIEYLEGAKVGGGT